MPKIISLTNQSSKLQIAMQLWMMLAVNWSSKALHTVQNDYECFVAYMF